MADAIAAVRSAREDDVDEIVRVANAAYRVEDFFIRGDRTSAEDVRARMARPGAEILVLDDETPGRLAGLVYLERRPGALWFGMLSVDPVKQGRGIARRLIGAVEVQARAEGLARVEIDVVDLRTELPAFYARLGYVQVGERPFPDPHKLTRPARMLVFRKRLEHAS